MRNTNEMPCPRFELEWTKDGKDWNKRICTYSLVIPLGEFDVRREDQDGNNVRTEVKAELGKTSVRSSDYKAPIWDDGTVQMPYRDGCHAIFDRKALGGHIPIVAICGDVFSVADEDS